MGRLLVCFLVNLMSLGALCASQALLLDETEKKFVMRSGYSIINGNLIIPRSHELVQQVGSARVVRCAENWKPDLYNRQVPVFIISSDYQSGPGILQLLDNQDVWLKKYPLLVQFLEQAGSNVMLFDGPNASSEQELSESTLVVIRNLKNHNNMPVLIVAKPFGKDYRVYTESLWDSFTTLALARQTMCDGVVSVAACRATRSFGIWEFNADLSFHRHHAGMTSNYEKIETKVQSFQDRSGIASKDTLSWLTSHLLLALRAGRLYVIALARKRESCILYPQNFVSDSSSVCTSVYVDPQNPRACCLYDYDLTKRRARKLMFDITSSHKRYHAQILGRKAPLREAWHRDDSSYCIQIGRTMDDCCATIHILLPARYYALSLTSVEEFIKTLQQHRNDLDDSGSAVTSSHITNGHLVAPEQNVVAPRSRFFCCFLGWFTKNFI